MKKNIVAMAGALALVAVVGIGATFAYFTDTESATNTFKMGNVDIQLTENGKVTEGLEFDNLVPGQVIDGEDGKDGKDVNIQNLGSQPAYIRVKVEFDKENWVAEEDETSTLDDSILNINSEEWTYNEEDNYYYHNGVVDVDADLDFFDVVSLPTAWDNDVADKSFKIAITAEAVQANANDDEVWPAVKKYEAPASDTTEETVED